MNRIEYLNLQTQVKNHFTWLRTKRAFSPIVAAVILLVMIYLGIFGIWNALAFGYIPKTQVNREFIVTHMMGTVSCVVLLLIVVKIFQDLILRLREDKILEVLEQAYSRNTPMEKVLYLPEFEKFYPCLDLDLTYETKKEYKSHIFDVSGMD